MPIYLRLLALTVVSIAFASALYTQPATYSRPEKAIKPDARSRELLLAAKTVTILAIDASVLEITSVDRDKKTITVASRGGIRRGIDVEKAKESVDKVMSDWGRFTVVNNPSDADLIVVVFEDSVSPSRFSKAGGDTKNRLRDTLAVFPGHSDDHTATPLWVDISTESTFGALTGSSARKVADKLRDYVQTLDKRR